MEQQTIIIQLVADDARALIEFDEDVSEEELQRRMAEMAD